MPWSLTILMLFVIEGQPIPGIAGPFFYATEAECDAAGALEAAGVMRRQKGREMEIGWVCEPAGVET